MRANKLKLHLGKAISATIIVLGSLMLIVGISKSIYRLPEISISDMAMSAIGIAALVVAKSKVCVNFLINPQSNTNIERTILAIGIFTCIGITAVKIFLGHSEFYQNSLDENSLIEWLTFLLLIISAYIHVCIGLTKEFKDGRRYFYATSFALFILGMEELSWGQMVFKWETPNQLALINSQGETTLHNIYGINTLIDPLLLAALTVAILLTIFLKTDNKKSDTYSYALEIITPSKSILPVISFAWIITSYIVLNPSGSLLQRGEIEWSEFLISFAVVMHSIQLLIRLCNKHAEQRI
mgnify:FL=1